MSDHIHTATQIEDERCALVRVPEATHEVKPYASDMRIDELNPSAGLLKGFCVEMQYETLSKIQAEMLPLIATQPHKNIVAQSPIGSGKSVSLVTAILYCVDPENKNIQAICIVQNDYSAAQSEDWLLKMGKHSPITCVLGIPPYEADYIPTPQMPPVEAQVIIGTPVTIRDWIVAKKLVLDDMKMLLIDDVDRVLAE
ncbi:DEAD-box ATP-dependent RNA helicase 38, partial [Tanacetum coccineum]